MSETTGSTIGTGRGMIREIIKTLTIVDHTIKKERTMIGLTNMKRTTIGISMINIPISNTMITRPRLIK